MNDAEDGPAITIARDSMIAEFTSVKPPIGDPFYVRLVSTSHDRRAVPVPSHIVIRGNWSEEHLVYILTLPQGLRVADAIDSIVAIRNTLVRPDPRTSIHIDAQVAELEMSGSFSTTTYPYHVRHNGTIVYFDEQNFLRLARALRAAAGRRTP